MYTTTTTTTTSTKNNENNNNSLWSVSSGYDLKEEYIRWITSVQAQTLLLLCD